MGNSGSLAGIVGTRRSEEMRKAAAAVRFVVPVLDEGGTVARDPQVVE